MHIGASVGRASLPSQVEAIERYSEHAERLSLDAIELDFSVRGHFPEYAPLPYPREDSPIWSEVSRRLDAFAVAGAHLPYFDLNPLSDDADIAEDAKIQHMDAIERAGDLGLLYAVIHMLGYRAGTDRTNWLPLWVDYLGELSLYAREAGLILCVENTSYGFFLKDLVHVIEEVGSPWLRMTLDTGHALIPGSRTAGLRGCPYEGYESMEAFVRQEHERIYSVHLHDNDGENDQHLVIGDGIGDFSYLRALREVGFAGPWTLEHEIDDWESIVVAVGRLRGLAGAERSST